MSSEKDSPVKICAVLGGGDWADASVDHLRIPADLDLDAAKQDWDHWYQTQYTPYVWDRSLPKVEYMSFVTWLVVNCGAEHATEDDIVIFDDT